MTTGAAAWFCSPRRRRRVLLMGKEGFAHRVARGEPLIDSGCASGTKGMQVFGYFICSIFFILFFLQLLPSHTLQLLTVEE